MFEYLVKETDESIFHINSFDIDFMLKYPEMKGRPTFPYTSPATIKSHNILTWMLNKAFVLNSHLI